MQISLFMEIIQFSVYSFQGRIVGGVCYRPYFDQKFAEIAFCAISGQEQVRESPYVTYSACHYGVTDGQIMLVMMNVQYVDLCIQN
jgi:hypothetical protein